MFQAIADPTRREIINLLAHNSLNLNSVAEKFDVSRPAISKHIKILTECGIELQILRGGSVGEDRDAYGGFERECDVNIFLRDSQVVLVRTVNRGDKWAIRWSD